MTDVPPGAGSPASSPEPPRSAGSPGGGSGLPENVAGALSYLLGPITGIVFFIIDRQRPFVRFHAVQSIALTIAWVVLWIGLTILGVVLNVVPILGTLIGILIWLAVTIGGFGLWLWLMFQAYGGNRWTIPVLGAHVHRLAAESAGGVEPR